MSDNPNKRRPRDAKRINVNEDYEVKYWSERFGTTPEELREAVKKVGTSAEAVQRELQAVRAK